MPFLAAAITFFALNHSDSINDGLPMKVIYIYFCAALDRTALKQYCEKLLYWQANIRNIRYVIEPSLQPFAHRTTPSTIKPRIAAFITMFEVSAAWIECSARVDDSPAEEMSSVPLHRAVKRGERHILNAYDPMSP
jgi:hypothetical protein